MNNMGMRRGFEIALYVALLLLASCTNGLDPMPDKVKDLTVSLSVPIGKGDFKIGDAYYYGAPNINLTVNVPDWAKHDTIYFCDTLSVDLSEIYDKSDLISYIAIKTNVWNEFPVEGKATIYFTNADGTVVYRFWDGKPLAIPKGDIFGDGNVLKPSFNNAVTTLTKEQIEQLREANNLIIITKIGLKGFNYSMFKFFSNYVLTCQVGARVDFEINDL